MQSPQGFGRGTREGYPLGYLRVKVPLGTLSPGRLAAVRAKQTRGFEYLGGVRAHQKLRGGGVAYRPRALPSPIWS